MQPVFKKEHGGQCDAVVHCCWQQHHSQTLLLFLPSLLPMRKEQGWWAKEEVAARRWEKHIMYKCGGQGMGERKGYSSWNHATWSLLCYKWQCIQVDAIVSWTRAAFWLVYFYHGFESNGICSRDQKRPYMPGPDLIGSLGPRVTQADCLIGLLSHRLSCILYISTAHIFGSGLHSRTSSIERIYSLLMLLNPDCAFWTGSHSLLSLWARLVAIEGVGYWIAVVCVLINSNICKC